MDRLAGPGLAGPGLAGPGLASPGLAGPGLASPGLASPDQAQALVQQIASLEALLRDARRQLRQLQTRPGAPAPLATGVADGVTTGVADGVTGGGSARRAPSGTPSTTDTPLPIGAG